MTYRELCKYEKLDVEQVEFTSLYTAFWEYVHANIESREHQFDVAYIILVMKNRLINDKMEEVLND